MSSLKYEQERNKLISSFPENLSPEADKNLNGPFNMVSAGLLNYFPTIPFENHSQIFRDILFYKKLSILEQGFKDVLKYTEIEGLTFGILALLKTRPTIICTFHTGSYRIINHFLLHNKIPYTLVIGNTVLEQDGETYSSIFNELYPDSTGNFQLLDAEAPSSGIQMLRELKKGRSLLVYVDGNTGAGTETTKNDNNCTVNFLQQQIYARKGIGYLSHVASAPIIPVVSYRKSTENICLKFSNPFLPTATNNKKEYAETTTQKVFDILASIITNYPAQWEGWLYIHKVAKITNKVDFTKSPETDSSAKEILFNRKFYGVLTINENTYLFSKNSYRFYAISQPLQNLLSGDINLCNLTCLPEPSIKELFETGVLRYG